MDREPTNLSQTAWLMAGFALGAVAMFITDPEAGRRRRALAMDKMQSAANSTSDYLSSSSRDLGNRVEGLRAETRDLMSAGERPTTDSRWLELAGRELWMLGGIAAGALAMFLADPQMGRRRRALANDKLRSAAISTRKYATSTARDLGNRAQGLRAEARGMLSRRGGRTSEAETMH